MGLGICRRFHAGGLGAGGVARCFGAGHPGFGARFRWRVGLADLVQPAHGLCPGDWLRLAGRHLAGLEDQRRPAAEGLWLAWLTGHATLALIGVVSLIMPFLDPVFRQRWFSWPNIIY